MMKKLLSLLLLVCLLCPICPALATEARLNQKMATRSGPGTKYTEELGTLPASTEVEVIEMVETNGTWWCMVEFRQNGKLYRTYTGKKRLNIYGAVLEGSVDYVEDITTGGADAYYGPGEEYAKRKHSVYKGTKVRVYDVDGEWALCDYKEEKKWARGYIHTDKLKNTQPGAKHTPLPTAVPTPTPTATPAPTATPEPQEAFNIIDPVRHICVDYYGNEYNYTGHSEQFALLVGSLPVMDYFDGVPCIKHSDVYSGPGSHYWRRFTSNGVYAYTGTLDKNLRIYGSENGWMLIRYPSDANSGYRYGWTRMTAISAENRARVKPVEFAYLPAVTTRFTDATDDPDRSTEYIGTTVTEHVTVTALAFLDESRVWVYCEYSLRENGHYYEYCRGFLPADSLRLQ